MTNITMLGLRRMFRRKEYGRMYSGLRKVKRRSQMKQRDCIIKGTAKMELDANKGRGYSMGNQMRDESKDEESEEEKRKKKKARTEKQKDNQRTRTLNL
jgi:hypothetical protein